MNSKTYIGNIKNILKNELIDILIISLSVILLSLLLILSFCIDALPIDPNSILVSITAIYVVFTWLLVRQEKDNQRLQLNTQRFEYLEKKLKLFYYPLKRLLSDNDNIDRNIAEVYNYQYLVEKGTETEKSFMNFIDSYISFKKIYKNHTNRKVTGLTIDDFFEEFKTKEKFGYNKPELKRHCENIQYQLNSNIKTLDEHINDDVTKIRNELNELVNNKR